jgi:hypothetical protein
VPVVLEAATAIVIADICLMEYHIPRTMADKKNI